MSCYLQRVIVSLGASVRHSIERLGMASRFGVALLLESGMCLRRPSLVVRELYFSGYQSLVIILVSGLFVGLVLGLQGYYTLRSYGATDSLGVLVALSLTRELGPVISALLFASRAGSAMTAGIGMMKSREELAAMSMMGVSPLARIVAPRFWGACLSLPLLGAFFSAMGILGGWLIGVKVIGIDNGIFWSQMQSGIDVYADVFNGVIKSIFFGMAIAWVSTFEGFNAQPTAEGVAAATTRTVVTSALTVLALDFVLTAFMFSL